MWFVYDARTTMTDFVASFALREHAVAYALAHFGEHGIVLNRKAHASGKMWDGRAWEDLHPRDKERS